ncbi:MAG TPA: DUF177 domain-containing protein [Bryobacteraceae bacterium]|nr:DUF177 domain-containing protein [Bryobacteraceae bacterium]
MAWTVIAPRVEVCVFFSVQDLERRKIRFDVSIPPGEIEYSDRKLRQVGDVKAEGTVELLGNTLGEIRVRGKLSVKIESDCDRCLEKAVFPIDSNFDLFYRPAAPAGHPAEEVEIDEGETEIAFYEGSGLLLNDILREYILLSIPMQRICAETCRGICPLCGQNRNLQACGCETKLVDDRWAALKKIHI